MAVGPSQAPMIPIDTACELGKAQGKARSKVRKIPNWPAAPRRKVDGWARTGPKSVIAPMPTKIRSGKSSVVDPGIIDGPDEALLAHDIRKGNIDQDTPEADGHQEKRLTILLDPEIQEDETHDKHDDVSPVDGQHLKSNGEAAKAIDDCVCHDLRLLLFRLFGNSLPKRPMTRLMIHKVRIVPPIPQTSIVIPNVTLSMHDTSILVRPFSRRRTALKNHFP